MKILHTADWHLGKKLNEYARLPEQQLALEEICKIADEQQSDIILISGDIYDTFNPPTEAIELLYATLKKLSRNGERPVIAISGNHDSTHFIAAPEPLAASLGIFFYSHYDTKIQPVKLESGVEISQSDFGFIEVHLPQYTYPARIILAPYANEMLLKTYLGDNNREAALRDLLTRKWKAIADEYMDDKGVNLFSGHFFFMKEGSKPDAEPESERPILHIGGAQPIYSNNLPEQIQYAALGHLHRYHSIDTQPCPVVYSSSLLAYSFSEANQPKYVISITAKPGEKVEISPIQLKTGRRLERQTFDNIDDALAWLSDNPYTFVELTIITDQAIDAASRRAIYKSHDGIVSIIPKLKNLAVDAPEGLQSEDLQQDISKLFTQYYESKNNGVAPNEAMMALFSEVIGQQEGGDDKE